MYVQGELTTGACVMTSYLFKNVCFCFEIKTGAEMLELDVCHVVCWKR